MSRARDDIGDYMTTLAVVESHLKAAQEAAVGLYMHNPVTHELPLLDDLTQRLHVIREDAIAAQERAFQKIAEMREATS